MTNFLHISFWLNFILFFIAIFFSFFVPGSLALSNIKLSRIQRLTLSTIVGIVLWGWQGWIFGYLSIRWMTYLYIVLTFIFWIRTYKNKLFDLIVEISKLKLKYKFDYFTFIIIILGIFVEIFPIWFTGQYFEKGLYLIGGDGSDNIWHIALTNEIVKNFPPNEPGMTGIVVKNYHYWANLIMADLIRIFHLPLLNVVFQYFFLLISTIFALSVLVFSEVLKLSKKYLRWLFFFLFFSGDALSFIMFAFGRGFNFNMGAMESGSMFLFNIPRAVAIVVFFGFLSLFVLWIRNRNLYLGILIAFVVASMIGFKVYVGIFAIIGLAFVGLYFLIKKDWRMVVPLLLTLYTSLAVYLSVNIGAGGLIFTGFWRAEDFIVNPNLDLSRLELARRVFLDHNNWLRVFQYELIFTGLFFTGVFGTKILSIFQTKKSLSKFPFLLNLLLIPSLIINLLLGFFFQQESGGANTFNFLVNTFILSSIYIALAVFFWLEKIKNKIFKLFLISIIILLSSTRVIYTEYTELKQFLSGGGFYITNDQLDAFTSIRNGTPKDSNIMIDDVEKLYVSFLADRNIYLVGKRILQSHGVKTKAREETMEKIVESNDPYIVAEELLKSKINYIFFDKYRQISSTESAYFLRTYYSNDSYRIYEVSQEYIQNFLKVNKKKQIKDYQY